MIPSRRFRKVAKGGALFTLGSLGGTFLAFFAGIIVIRTLERSEYGLVSLGMTVVTMLSVLSMLGFKTAVPRFLAKCRAQANQERFGQVAGTALACAVGISLLLAALLNGGSRFAALAFQKEEMTAVFQVLALMLPAIVVMDTLTAIFQGTENALPKVLFEDLGTNMLRLFLLLPVVLAACGLKAVLWVYAVSAWIALAIYLVYTVRAFKGELVPRLSWTVATELLWFSFPLLGISLMANMMTWTAVLTLGYLAPAVELGRFSAPMRLAKFIAVPLAGMVFLYLPVATRIAERSGALEVQELYCTTTKWAFLATLPFLLYLFIDAEFVVTALFGGSYGDSAEVLMIMVVGIGISTFVGPNAKTLVAFGVTTTQFAAVILGTLAAVGLCLLLVPRYGAVGAAAGTAVARVVSTVYISVSLFIRFKIHPLVPTYLKPVLLAVIFAAAAGLLLRMTSIKNPIAHLLVFLAITGVTLSAPVLTRALTEMDLDVLGALERRVLGRPRIVERIARWIDREPPTRGAET